MENKEENTVEEQEIENLGENVAEENTENTESSDENMPELSDTEKLQLEVGELKDKYIRLYSEFDNFRKRTAKEKIDLVQTASEGLITELIPVIDDYERATANAKEGEISEGIKLIFIKLNNILQARGLKEMTAKGEVFNADIHDCITQFPAPTEEEKGKVVDVLEKGFYLKEKVIRFAKVIVGN